MNEQYSTHDQHQGHSFQFSISWSFFGSRGIKRALALQLRKPQLEICCQHFLSESLSSVWNQGTSLWIQVVFFWSSVLNEKLFFYRLDG